MGALVFDLEPVLVNLGPFQIRYYGLVFAATLLTAFVLWRRQMLRGGHSHEVTDGFLMWGVLAVIIGARLGHCFFYHPARYLADPISVLRVWEGGLASHGATIGLLLAATFYAIRHKIRVLELMDRFAMSAAVGAAGIRLGNFLNSEVVGRPTDVPWAVIFKHWQAAPNTPLHPSQLYEFAMGICVLLVLIAVDRLAGKEKRPMGIMVGTFMAVYFAGRFCVEFVKDYHVDDLKALHGLTMGQYLSIVPFVAGVAMVAYALWRGKPADRPKPQAKS